MVKPFGSPGLLNASSLPLLFVAISAVCVWAAEPAGRLAPVGLGRRGLGPLEGPSVVDGTSTLAFFTASDTHLGWDPVNQPACNSTYTSYELNRVAVEYMNHLPGTFDWPEELGGGKVQEPRGVPVSGDLVDNGHLAAGYSQWLNFTSLFGLSGEGLLKWPVFEGDGNHDGGNLTCGLDEPNFIRAGIKTRNRLRGNVVQVSSNELHYAWEWPVSASCNIHFIMLNIFPGKYGEHMEKPFYGPAPTSWVRPEHSLEFLRSDLETHIGDSGRPVVIFQHYGFDGFSNTWWADEERAAYAEVLAPYNILAIFVGHTHAANYYQWAGYDVVNTPCTQGDAAWKGLPDPQFMAVEVSSDDGGVTGSIRTAQWKGANWGPVRWRKDGAPLCSGPGGFSARHASELLGMDLGVVHHAVRDFSTSAPPEYFDSHAYASQAEQAANSDHADL